MTEDELSLDGSAFAASALTLPAAFAQTTIEGRVQLPEGHSRR